MGKECLPIQGEEPIVVTDTASDYKVVPMQFYFYTLMVFDEHHNGVPVAWVITSSQKEENLVVWMGDLQRHMRVAMRISSLLVSWWTTQEQR